LPQSRPDRAQLVAAGLRVGLQPTQRLHQHLLDLVEVAAQRIVRQAAVGTERCQRRRQRLWRVALLALRVGLGRRQQLVRGLCLLQQAALERGFGDRRHRMHAVLVGQAAQIGDAVFVEVDVAQVARDGGVPVVPAHVGFALALVIARRAEHQDAARFRQGMCHRHEVVLATHAGHHTSVVQRIRHGRAQCSGHHAGVEEARMAALQALQRLVAAIQLVDFADAAHADRTTFVFRQRAQPLVELRRAQVERAVQVLALGRQGGVVDGQRAAVLDALHQRQVVVHLALDHPGLHKPAEAFVEHLAAAVQAHLERIQSADLLHQRVAGQLWIQRMQHAAVARVVGVAQHQRMAERVGQRADADLQGAAITHQRAGVQADGVVGIAHRLPRQPEQRRVRRRRGDHQIEERHIDRGRAAHVRQLRIDLGDQQRARQPARGHRIQRVLGDVVVARQRKPAIVRSHRHLLHDHLRRALRDRIGGVGVVQAGIAGLRLPRTEQGAGLHVELFHLHMCRQRIARDRIGIGQAREIVAEMALRERRHEARFQAVAARLRRVQRQRGIQLQRSRWIVLDACIKGIEQPMRLAQCQRCPDPQWPVHARKQPVDGGVQVGEVFGHARRSCVWGSAGITACRA